MTISKEELIAAAAENGFRIEILEKVWRLMDVLDGINRHPYLKDRLALKGGTALNLFIFHLPRLSVDIDLNYIGQVDREEMLKERPVVERALEAVFNRNHLRIRRFPVKHAGGKWQLRYESVSGGYGNLEVDLNYMFRIPLFQVRKQQSYLIGGRKTGEVAILDLHELLTKKSFDWVLFRTTCVLYGAMGGRDWREVSVDEIHFKEEELRSQLIPVMRKGVFGSQSEWKFWKENMISAIRKGLEQLFPLEENEVEFLHCFFDRGVLEGSLLTSDEEMLDKIGRHPLLRWKLLV